MTESTLKLEFFYWSKDLLLALSTGIRERMLEFSSTELSPSPQQVFLVEWSIFDITEANSIFSVHLLFLMTNQ